MQHADTVTSQAVVDLGTAYLTNAMYVPCCTCCMNALSHHVYAIRELFRISNVHRTRLVIMAGNRANRQRWLGILLFIILMPFYQCHFSI